MVNAAPGGRHDIQKNVNKETIKTRVPITMNNTEKSRQRWRDNGKGYMVPGIFQQEDGDNNGPVRNMHVTHFMLIPERKDEAV